MKRVNGINITDISLGIFKISLQEFNRIDEEKSRVLDDDMAQTDILGTNLVTIFGFLRQAHEPLRHLS